MEIFPRGLGFPMNPASTTTSDIWLENLAPREPVGQYRHDAGEDNADAHLKRSVMGREAVVMDGGFAFNDRARAKFHQPCSRLGSGQPPAVVGGDGRSEGQSPRVGGNAQKCVTGMDVLFGRHDIKLLAAWEPSLHLGRVFLFICRHGPQYLPDLVQFLAVLAPVGLFEILQGQVIVVESLSGHG